MGISPTLTAPKPTGPAGGPATPVIIPARASPAAPRAVPDLVGSTLPLVEFDDPETGDLAVAGAQFDNDAVENNYWWMFERRTWERQFDMAAQMSEALYGDAEAWKALAPAPPAPMNDPSAYLTGAKTNPNQTPALERLFEAMARQKADDPGRFANFPASLIELKNLAKNTAAGELKLELSDAQGRLANRSDPNLLGGAASFAGSMAAAVSDAEGVATLPLGAGSGTLMRTLLLESLLGGASTALQVPGQQRQAARLGTEAPDPVAEIMAGFAFGAALPLAGRGLRLGVNSFTKSGRITNRELLGLAAKKPDLTDTERGAVAALARDEASQGTAPEGIDPGAHAAGLNAADQVLADDAPQMVRGADVIPGGNGPEVPREGAQPQRLPAEYPDTEDRLMGIINAAEAPRGFDTVSDFTRVAPPQPLTEMTVSEVMEWQQTNRAAGAESTAAGGFQIISGTLSDLKARLKLTGDEVFDEAMQKRMARALMEDAGLKDYLAGRLSPAAFGNGLAKIWAGLPELTGPNAGRSHYAGDGLNGATVSSAQFLAVLADGSTYRAPKYLPGSDAQSAGVHAFNPADLQTDAGAYQYKSGGDQFGVTDRLQGERVWDARAAMGVIVHERLDGGYYVADGHQRFGLARRFMDQGQSDISLVGHLYREADGFTVSDVRSIAAKKNILQETGTALDAAKIIRNNPEMLRDVNGSRSFMQQARGLAELSPGPFQAVVNDIIPERYGAIVGRLMPADEKMQAVAIDALRVANPATEIQAESVVRDIRRLGLEAENEAAQLSLFSDGFDLRKTVISERARVIDAVSKNARAGRTLFRRLEDQADTIEGAGNVLNRTENANQAALADRIASRVLIAAEQPGPLRDAIDAAAKSVRAGASLDAAVRDVFDAFSRQDGDAAVRTAADGTAGRGDAGAPLAAPSLLDQPALGDARLQKGLFDDPVDDATEIARLARLERDLAIRLQAEPTFDMDLPGTASGTLRAELDDQAVETDFINKLQLSCKPKGA